MEGSSKGLHNLKGLEWGKCGENIHNQNLRGNFDCRDQGSDMDQGGDINQETGQV